MVEEMEPAAPINPRIVSTLKKLENERTVLLRTNNRHGLLLSVSRNSVFAAEKVPTARITYMAKAGYILEKRRSAFDEMGWLEYDLTYEGMMIIREHK